VRRGSRAREPRVAERLRWETRRKAKIEPSDQRVTTDERERDAVREELALTTTIKYQPLEKQFEV